VEQLLKEKCCDLQ